MGTRLIETAKKINNKIKRLENLIKETQEKELEYFEKNYNDSRKFIEELRANKNKYKSRIKNICFAVGGLIASLAGLAFGLSTGLTAVSIAGTTLMGCCCFVVGYSKPSSFNKYKETKKKLEILETINKYQIYTKSEKLQAMERSLEQKNKEYKKIMQEIHNVVKSKKIIEVQDNIETEDVLEK